MNGDIVKLLHNWIRADRYDILKDGSDNTVYLVYRGNEKYILRQSKKLKKKKDFEFEINFIEYLSEHNLPVPKVIRNNQGSPITYYNDVAYCLFSFCSGDKFCIDKEHSPSFSLAYNAGQTLAHFHMISKEYSYKVPPRRTMISELRRVIRTSRGFAKHYENGINFVHEVEEMLDSPILKNKPNCIIHNDFRAHNLLFNKDQVSAILDFDWACPGNSLKDLGHALVEWSYPDGAKEHNPAIFHHFLKGYTSIFPDIELDQLQFWIRFSCLSDAATYFRDRLYDTTKIRPIRSYMYKKYLYFSSQNIA